MAFSRVKSDRVESALCAEGSSFCLLPALFLMEYVSSSLAERKKNFELSGMGADPVM